MAKTINHKDYEITIEQSPVSGMYKLSAWVETPSNEWLETMTSDTLDNDVLDKFIRQCEASK